MSVKSNTCTEFGRLVLDICRREKVSQAKLTTRSKLTRRKVDHIQRGKLGPTRAEVIQLINALPTTSEDIHELFRLLHQFHPHKELQRSHCRLKELLLQMDY